MSGVMISVYGMKEIFNRNLDANVFQLFNLYSCVSETSFSRILHHRIFLTAKEGRDEKILSQFLQFYPQLHQQQIK